MWLAAYLKLFEKGVPTIGYLRQRAGIGGRHKDAQQRRQLNAGVGLAVVPPFGRHPPFYLLHQGVTLQSVLGRQIGLRRTGEVGEVSLAGSRNKQRVAVHRGEDVLQGDGVGIRLSGVSVS